MAAPTLVTSYLPAGTTGGTGNWSTTTTPKTVSVTTAAGDLLVTLAAAEDGATSFSTPSGGTSVSWTSLADIGTSGASARATVWSAQPSAQTFTESISNVGTTHDWSYATVRISGATGIGTPVSTTNGGSTPSLSITTTQANSGILVIIADWNATAGTSYTYRQVNGANPTAIVAGAGTAGTDYRVWVLWYADAGAAGAKTVGMTVPSGQNPAMVAVEIKGSVTSSNGSVTAVKATATAAAGVPTVTGTSSGIVSGSPWSSPHLVTTNATGAITAVAATASAAAVAPSVLVAGGVVSGSPWSSPHVINVTAVGSPITVVVATGTATTGFPVITGEHTVTGSGPGTATSQAAAPVVTGTAAGSTTVVAIFASSSSAGQAPAVTGEHVTSGAGPAAATAQPGTPAVNATSTIVGSLINVLAAVANCLVPPPLVTGTDGTVVLPVTWLFTPPTHEEGAWLTNRWLRRYRLTRANSIYWDGTKWVSARNLSDDLVRTLVEGVTYFRGGSPYVITDDVAQSLIAAGYAPVLAT